MRRIEGLFTRMIKFVFKFRKIKYDIAFIEFSYPSGSNTRILYEYLQDNYDLRLLFLTRSRPLSFTQRIKEYIVFNYRLSTAKILVGTHGVSKIKRNQIVINLWHGVPLKAMSNMEKGLLSPVKFNDDYLITSSMFESVLLTSCMFIPYEKHRHFGSPRLDYLVNSNASGTLIDEIKHYKYSIIYMPTFRNQEATRQDGVFNGNMFNMELFDVRKFNEFLVHNDILLITKYHPFEVGKLKESLSEFSNIKNISNNDLIEECIDLYELLPFTDLLITDYSSIYFDYMLLDKPMIFTPTDLEEYSQTRGLLLQPYENWTPGAKVLTQVEIEKTIIEELKFDTYKEIRTKLKHTVFMNENTVGNNTEKTAKFIVDIIKNRKK